MVKEEGAGRYKSPGKETVILYVVFGETFYQNIVKPHYSNLKTRLTYHLI